MIWVTTRMLLSMNVEIDRDETSRNSASSAGSCVRLKAILHPQVPGCVLCRPCDIHQQLGEPPAGELPGRVHHVSRHVGLHRLPRALQIGIGPVQQLCPIGAPARGEDDRILQQLGIFRCRKQCLVQALDPTRAAAPERVRHLCA
ncbi:hypothetical protein PPS11_07720 [Pseudomonas putida S11]|nr:hypothetical protein PPS11_07720 [Pseudomonas putida S11]